MNTSMTFKLNLPVRTKIKLAVRHKDYAPKNNIIEKYCEGVIVEVANPSTGELNYAVRYNDINYTISKENYNTNKKRKVYVKDSNGRWIEYDRVVESDRKPLLHAIPFMPGMVCKGSIIEKDNKQIFNISACYKSFDKKSKNEELKKLDLDSE